MALCVSLSVSLDNMQDWEVKQEKAGEAGIVKTYITNDETSL
jgi:hypothetical protein